MGQYAKIFKAYDIRGVVPDELDEAVAEAVGARVRPADRGLGHRRPCTTCGPRPPRWRRRSAAGSARQGADVIAGGLGSTDMLYYASGSLGIPGAMITASHNPPKYNGIKLCRAGARPVGADSGLAELRRPGRARASPAPGGPPGTVTGQDLLAGYAGYLKTLVDLSGIRPLTVAVDAGNGMAGHTVPSVFAGLPIKLVPLYFELDGTFPNHEANPIDPRQPAATCSTR